MVSGLFRWCIIFLNIFSANFFICVIQIGNQFIAVYSSRIDLFALLRPILRGLAQLWPSLAHEPKLRSYLRPKERAVDRLLQT